jgi:hypothetical protein
MGSLILSTLILLPAQPAAEPPVVGRPLDWSGAVGGPFVVELHAEPTTLTAEEPLTLTVRVIGSGNLRDLPRPPLGKLESFQPFAVEDLDDRFVPGDPPRREFRYRLRPRSADVTEVPRLKFVFFNPRLPRARGYQTTYSNEVPLTVKPRSPVVPPEVVEEVPDWMLDPATREEILGRESGTFQQWVSGVLGRLGVRLDSDPRRSTTSWPLAIAVVALPPVICVAWFILWLRANPNAARVALARRSRAASVALRALESAGDDQPRRVADAVLRYLIDRFGLPPSAVTPAEVEAHLSGQDAMARSTMELLKRCDAARFAPAAADEALAGDAERLVHALEARR